MDDKIALKRLSASDLSILRAKFGVTSNSNQKAINLNADVFVDELFPDLRGTTHQIALPLEIFGPCGFDVYAVARKIVPSSASYKNWRLNGEFIPDPDDQPGRFDVLRANDVAVLAFSGDRRPHRLRIYFLAQDNADDQPLWAQLTQLLEPVGSKRSLKRIEADALDSILDGLGHDETHPLRAVTLTLDDPDVELAALGDAAAEKRLARRGAGRAMSADDLAKAMARANQVGRDGEAAVNAYLTKQKEAGGIADFEWVADENAVSPFDFSVTQKDGTIELVDVKSTAGEHERSFHLSAGEVESAFQASEAYRVYRVSGIRSEEPKLRISAPIRTLCGQIRDVAASLPSAILIDSVKVPTEALVWESSSIPLADED